MKEVVIVETFDGYPNGKKVTFTAGPEAVTLSDAYADLIVGKGHARYQPAERPAPAKSAAKGAGSAPNEDKSHEDE